MRAVQKLDVVAQIGGVHPEFEGLVTIGSLPGDAPFVKSRNLAGELRSFATS